MIASLFLLKFFKGKPKNAESPQNYLEKFKVEQQEAITIHSEDDRQIESTQDYLEREGLDQTAIQIIKEDATHRRTARMIVLLTVVPMSTIIQIWLLVLLTLSGMKKVEYSEGIQYSLLGVGVLDYIGLCYVIAGDLFPKGSSSRRKSLAEDGDSNEE